MKSEEWYNTTFLVWYICGMSLWCIILIEVFVSWGGNRFSTTFGMMGLYVLGVSVYFYQKHERYLNKKARIEKYPDDDTDSLIAYISDEIGVHNNKFALLFLLLAIGFIIVSIILELKGITPSTEEPLTLSMGYEINDVANFQNKTFICDSCQWSIINANKNFT